LVVAAVVTFVFTDLVGSTEMLDRLGDDGAESLRRTHFRILREAVAGAGGVEVKNLGDGLMVAFESARAAVDCAVAMQRGVHRHNSRAIGRQLSVRVGLHVGEPIRDEDDYFGTPVVIAKRLCDAASGGQILASDLVFGLVGRRDGVSFRSVGQVSLKGLAEPMPAQEIVWQAQSGSAAADEPLDPRALRFVGREAEQDLLAEQLTVARSGRLRIVLLTGEPGIGKTRLAKELLVHNRESALTLSARAYPLGATASLGLWVEALEGHLRAIGPDEVRALCGAGAADLAALLPAVVAAGIAPPAVEPPRVRLLGGLAALLTELAVPAPVIVCLDDVHWADGSSWEALNYLTHNLTDRPILIVLTARTTELAAAAVASSALLGLEQEGFLVRRTLDPLDAAEVRSLAIAATGRDQVSDRLVRWLVERSAGTPLFAAGLLRALLEEGADLDRPSLTRLPEDLSQRLEMRLRDLEAPARSVLELVAMAGERVGFSDLQSLSGQGLDELAGRLDELVRQRLVAEIDSGRDLYYEMAHPLLGEAVVRGLGGARRRALHRHIARALVTAGRPGAAATHFVASSSVGDPEAVDALRAALAQAEARELHREALALLQALLELLPAGDARWLEVADALALQPEWIVDHRADVGSEIGAEAMRRIDQVLAARPDPQRQGAVQLNLAVFLAWGLGEYDAALPLCETAAQRFAQSGDRRAELLARSEIGYLHWQRREMTQWQTIAEEVLAAGRATGDEFVVLQGLSALAHCQLLGGTLEMALDTIDDALACARATGRLYRTSYLLAQGALALSFLGRIPEATARLAEGKAANPAFRDTLLIDWGITVDHLAGRLAAGVDSFREQLAWTGGYGRRRAWGASEAAIAAAELGRVDEADAIVAALREVFGGRRWQLQGDQVPWAAAVVAGLTGSGPVDLEPLIESVRGQSDGGWPDGPYTRLMLADLAELAAGAGDRAAADVVEVLAGRCDPLSSGPGLAAVLEFASAGAALARGAAKETVDSLKAATVDLDRAGWPLLAGRAAAMLGRAAARAGDRDTALAALTEAAARFEACGAVVRRDRAAEDLRGLGARGRRAGTAVTGPEALSKREREVARLAAGGASAKEIAGQLFIAERTVETHLSAVYTKLGIGSRAELAGHAGAFTG